MPVFFEGASGGALFSAAIAGKASANDNTVAAITLFFMVAPFPASILACYGS
jgi:hypothetical protein